MPKVVRSSKRLQEINARYFWNALKDNLKGVVAKYFKISKGGLNFRIGSRPSKPLGDPIKIYSYKLSTHNNLKID